ncbi:hypothetical protein AGMMS49525_15110 [Bacteroidia bacterium]|nr:hypothetical protein AGMMS49525_15110 [Bacteroidia bacterium]
MHNWCSFMLPTTLYVSATWAIFPNEYGGSQYPNRPALDENYLREVVRNTGDFLEEKPIK